MSRSVVALLCSLLLSLSPMSLRADPYIGYFVGEHEGRDYRVNIDPVSSATYDGILTIDGERMQLDARRYGENLTGLLRNHSEQFGFRGRVILRRSNPP